MEGTTNYKHIKTLFEFIIVII